MIVFRQKVETISAVISVCCPVMIPNTAMPASRITPMTRRGILSMIRDAIKIPNGAPNSPNMVMNCDCEVSYPKDLSRDGIQFIKVY